jgi:regulator of replication initiation timing
MEAELIAARERIIALEHQIQTCMNEAERVRQDARNLHRAQHQLQNELFMMQRRLDNYALSNTQLARQVYPPPPHTVYPAHEVLTVDFA